MFLSFSYAPRKKFSSPSAKIAHHPTLKQPQKTAPRTMPEGPTHTQLLRNKLGWGPSNAPQRRGLPYELGAPHEKSLSPGQGSASAASWSPCFSRKPR